MFFLSSTICNVCRCAGRNSCAKFCFKVQLQNTLEGMITIKIYDALRRERRTLANEFKQTGHHTAEFDASKLACGMYIDTLVTDKYSAVKRMILTK
jgi:hypothetical protein